MEDNTKDCLREMERVETYAKSAESAKWERLSALKIPPAEEVMDVLKEICRQGKSMETEAEKEHTQLQKQAENLQCRDPRPGRGQHSVSVERAGSKEAAGAGGRKERHERDQPSDQRR